MRRTRRRLDLKERHEGGYRETAGRASIDGNGDFAAEIVAPATSGQHELIVRQGEDDPAPAAVTVPVVAPKAQS